jgi:hypothetical protein
MGIVNTIYYFGKILPEDIKFCPPKGSSAGQAAKIVNDFMDKNPKILHIDFRIIAGLALKSAWPC